MGVRNNGGTMRSTKWGVLVALASAYGCQEQTAPAVEGTSSPLVTDAFHQKGREVDAGLRVGEDSALPQASPLAVIPVAANIASRGNSTLVETLSAARCQRELRCERVGTDKEHASLTACREQIALSWREELNRYACDGEVDREALGACMQDIQQVECGKPFETLKPIASCKLTALCGTRR